jgi:hypothetical protein
MVCRFPDAHRCRQRCALRQRNAGALPLTKADASCVFILKKSHKSGNNFFVPISKLAASVSRLSSARRQRPVKAALPIHVLPSLHRLVLPNAVVLVVAGDLPVLGRLEPRETHHFLHLPGVVVHILGLLCVLRHLDIWSLFLLDSVAGRGGRLDGTAARGEVGLSRPAGRCCAAATWTAWCIASMAVLVAVTAASTSSPRLTCAVPFTVVLSNRRSRSVAVVAALAATSSWAA